MYIPFIHFFVESDRFRSISINTMSPCVILLLFIISINHLSFADLKLNRMISSDTTCVTIPLSALSSRSDDKFAQLKLFSPVHFSSNHTTSLWEI